MTDDVALGSGNSPLHSCKQALQFFSCLHKFLLVTSHGWLAAHSTVGRVRRLWDLSCFAISRPSNSLRVKGWIPFQGPGQHREIGSCVSNIIQQLKQWPSVWLFRPHLILGINKAILLSETHLAPTSHWNPFQTLTSSPPTEFSILCHFQNLYFCKTNIQTNKQNTIMDCEKI